MGMVFYFQCLKCAKIKNKRVYDFTLKNIDGDISIPLPYGVVYGGYKRVIVPGDILKELTYPGDKLEINLKYTGVVLLSIFGKS